MRSGLLLFLLLKKDMVKEVEEDSSGGYEGVEVDGTVWVLLVTCDGDRAIYHGI